jgi:hypothetical protein
MADWTSESSNWNSSNNSRQVQHRQLQMQKMWKENPKAQFKK